jgi:uncharacterized protein
MQYKKFDHKYLIRIDKGEEIVATLKKFCQDNKIMLGSISGIGATNQAVIGLFDPQTKKYSSRELTGNYEISGLSGNVTTMNGEIYLHLHITLGDATQNSFGGHLTSAIVSATCECIIDSIPGAAERKFDGEIGLNLLELN